MPRKKVIKDISELIEKAKNWNKENEYFSCNIKLKEEGKTFKAYDVSICHRDLLFFTDKGTLNYDVNTIGSNDFLMLVSIGE